VAYSDDALTPEQIGQALGLTTAVVREIFAEIGVAPGVARVPLAECYRLLRVARQRDLVSVDRARAGFPVAAADGSARPGQLGGSNGSGPPTARASAPDRSGDDRRSSRNEADLTARLERFSFAITHEQVGEFMDRIATTHRSAVISGRGSGALTLLPYRIVRPSPQWPRLLPDGEQLVVVYDRDQAVTGLSSFVAEHLDGTEPGPRGLVGYATQSGDEWDESNSLVYSTAGALVRRLRDGTHRSISRIILAEDYTGSILKDLTYALLACRIGGWDPHVLLHSRRFISPTTAELLELEGIVHLAVDEEPNGPLAWPSVPIADSDEVQWQDAVVAATIAAAQEIRRHFAGGVRRLVLRRGFDL
jgi:hypothetical protein